MNTIFEWDDEKARINKQKHKVSFETAAYVFDDPFCITVQDRFENGEYRWQTIGKLYNGVVLLVAHTFVYDHETEIIRIISARKATTREKQRYENR